MRQCYNCDWEWRKPHQPAFREMCPRCEVFLHSCRNCSLYDETARHECKNPTIEFISDKERGNFCEEFRFIVIEPPPSARSMRSAKAAKAAEEASKQTEDDRLDPREKWRRLFKDD